MSIVIPVCAAKSILIPSEYQKLSFNKSTNWPADPEELNNDGCSTSGWKCVWSGVFAWGGDELQFIVHIVQLFILPTGAVDTSTDYHDLASCSELLHNDNSILQPH